MSYKVCIRWDQIDFEVYGRNDKEKAHAGRRYKNENILNFQWKYYEIVSFWSIYKRIAWSVSKFVYVSKPLFGAECWYRIFVFCTMYHCYIAILKRQLKQQADRRIDYEYLSVFMFYYFWNVKDRPQCFNFSMTKTETI